jgi:uroporphyrinogen-III synthase
MERAWFNLQDEGGTAISALLYHPRRPCANPGPGVMMNKQKAIGVKSKIMADKLNGYRILILESREEAQFSRLLAEQGADVVQCPMFTIDDAPDPKPIEAWIRRFIERPCDDLVLMTGEGLRRLMKVARRMGIEQDFVTALGKARKFARGPKPGRALREIGLEPQMTTEKPTSEGIAEMLARVDLRGHRVGLQLYPDKDHSVLIGAIAAQGAEVDTVAPYVYDAQVADANIMTAIDEMAQGRIDAIALTNLGQVRRLFEVAKAHQCETQLRDGLARTPIASVGPVVSDELKSHGLRADISPANDAYFMKPLISAMAAALRKSPPRSTVIASQRAGA